MSNSKLWRIFLSLVIVSVALCLPGTRRLQLSQGLLGNPAQMQRADGGGPVPPLPPPASLSSRYQQSPLLADGGGPVPPLPPPSRLTADGGGPVPPLPPPFLGASLAAV